MILRDQITLEEAYVYTDGRNVAQYKFDGATVPANPHSFNQQGFR